MNTLIPTRLIAKILSIILRHSNLNTGVAIAVIAIASATPAAAADPQGARFKFAPTYYKLEEPRMPRTHYGTTVRFPEQNQQSITSVKSGNVPNVQSLLGFNPNFIAPTTNTNVAWHNPAPHVVPQVNVPHPQSLTAPTAQIAPSSHGMKPLAMQQVSARLVPPRSKPGLTVKQKTSSSKAVHQHSVRPAKVLKYDNGGMFDPSSTHPGLYASNSHATTSLSGKILPSRKN